MTVETTHSARKRLSSLAEDRAEEADPQPVADAIYDAILCDETLARLVTIAEEAYAVSSENGGIDSELGTAAFRGATELDAAIEARVEEIEAEARDAVEEVHA